jgi:hypothetical protein
VYGRYNDPAGAQFLVRMVMPERSGQIRNLCCDENASRLIPTHGIDGKPAPGGASHEGLIMSNRAEECLRKAERCEHAATVATDPEAQRTYGHLAQQWREMATHFEAKEQRIAAQRRGVMNVIGVGEPSD